LNKYVALVFVPVGIGINVLGGYLAQTFKLPVFLDTIGTILAAAILGPWWGALTGGLSNVISSISNPLDMWFLIVNVAVGLIVGFISMKYGFQKWLVVLSTGLILGVVTPIIGAFIAVYIYGGLTGGGIDIFTAGILKFITDRGGQPGSGGVLTAAFIPRLFWNLVDKPLSAFIVMAVILALPAGLKGFAAGPGAKVAPAEPASAPAQA
jgi:energy-coupling factor transport system substrate-specific component